MGKPTLEIAVSRFCSMFITLLVGIRSGELFDVDLADVRALVGDGEGAADQEELLRDGIIGPGLDCGGREILLRISQRDRLRLSVVEQEFDFKRAFHDGCSFHVSMGKRWVRPW